MEIIDAEAVSGNANIVIIYQINSSKQKITFKCPFTKNTKEQCNEVMCALHHTLNKTVSRVLKEKKKVFVREPIINENYVSKELFITVRMYSKKTFKKINIESLPTLIMSTMYEIDYKLLSCNIRNVRSKVDLKSTASLLGLKAVENKYDVLHLSDQQNVECIMILTKKQ